MTFDPRKSPARIPPFLAMFQVMWEAMPYLSFGQVIEKLQHDYMLDADSPDAAWAQAFSSEYASEMEPDLVSSSMTFDDLRELAGSTAACNCIQ